MERAVTGKVAALFFVESGGGRLFLATLLAARAGGRGLARSALGVARALLRCSHLTHSTRDATGLSFPAA